MERTIGLNLALYFKQLKKFKYGEHSTKIELLLVLTVLVGQFLMPQLLGCRHSSQHGIVSTHDMSGRFKDRVVVVGHCHHCDFFLNAVKRP